MPTSNKVGLLKGYDSIASVISHHMNGNTGSIAFHELQFGCYAAYGVDSKSVMIWILLFSDADALVFLKQMSPQAELFRPLIFGDLQCSPTSLVRRTVKVWPTQRVGSTTLHFSIAEPKKEGDIPRLLN